MKQLSFYFFTFCLSIGSVFGQTDSTLNAIEDYLLHRDQDTSFIKNHSDKIGIRFVSANKFNFFQIKERKGGDIAYRPSLGINFGVGGTYKGISLDLLFNLGLREELSLTSKQFIDIQIRTFTSKLLIEGILQYYNGYGVIDLQDRYNSHQVDSKIRDDVRTTNLGLQLLYASNYDKFSLKAPFVLNEIQRKSAGSPIFGANFNLINIDADSSLVPPELLNEFDTTSYLKNLNVLNFAASIGYMHSFVINERWFATLGLIPGVNISYGDYTVDYREFIDWRFSFRVKTMNSFGYNTDKFYTGFQIMGDFVNISVSKDLALLYSNGSLKYFVGYRFTTNKKKKKNKRWSFLKK